MIDTDREEVERTVMKKKTNSYERMTYMKTITITQFLERLIKQYAQTPLAQKAQELMDCQKEKNLLCEYMTYTEGYLWNGTSPKIDPFPTALYQQFSQVVSFVNALMQIEMEQNHSRLLETMNKSAKVNEAFNSWVICVFFFKMYHVDLNTNSDWQILIERFANKNELKLMRARIRRLVPEQLADPECDTVHELYSFMKAIGERKNMVRDRFKRKDWVFCGSWRRNALHGHETCFPEEHLAYRLAMKDVDSEFFTILRTSMVEERKKWKSTQKTMFDFFWPLNTRLTDLLSDPCLRPFVERYFILNGVGRFKLGKCGAGKKYLREHGPEYNFIVFRMFMKVFDAEKRQSELKLFFRSEAERKAVMDMLDLLESGLADMGLTMPEVASSVPVLYEETMQCMKDFFGFMDKNLQY